MEVKSPVARDCVDHVRKMALKYANVFALAPLGDAAKAEIVGAVDCLFAAAVAEVEERRRVKAEKG